MGRQGVPADVRALIREMSRANPIGGASRIHGELQKLGISVSQSSSESPGTAGTLGQDCGTPPAPDIAVIDAPTTAPR
jgi:hypothetical protein